MKKFLIGALALLTLAGCDDDSRHPLTSNYTANGYNVQYLFEQDGCKMYRTDSGSRYIYFLTCPGGQTSSQYTCGKNCIGTDEVRTK